MVLLERVIFSYNHLTNTDDSYYVPQPIISSFHG